MIVNESSFMLVLYRLLYALGTSRGFKRAPIIVMASVSYSISLILNFPPKCSHRLRQFREIADPADAASVRTKLPMKLQGKMESRHQKLLALLLIAMYCIPSIYFIANGIVSAMNGDYTDMALGIVFCGIGGWIVFNACKQDTGGDVDRT